VREAKLTEPQIQVRMDRVLRDEVDEFRRKHPDLPTRPSAIRQLLKEALAARQEQTASHLHDLAQAG
jgi:metal-responsive CopG/Arc/MetJ family transcriptional regulator